MPRRTFITALAFVMLLVIIAGATTLYAQTGGTYDLTWSTLDGSGTSSGGVFGLSGTIGQAEAGEMSGGAFVLRGGFWLSTTAAAGHDLFLPLILRQN